VDQNYLNEFINQGSRQINTLKQMQTPARSTIPTSSPLAKKQTMKKSGSLTKHIDDMIPLAVVDHNGKVKTKLKAEVADTPNKRAKGLSKRSSLATDHSMLFTHSGAFWMKGCEIDLDIVFMDKTGTILDAQTMVSSKAPDQYLATYRSRTLGDALALEANAGWIKQNNIQIGDKVIVGE
jgi:uncharacterized protein